MSLMAADERRELEDEARVITTNVKAWIVRRNYMKVREAARTLEARWIQRRSTSRDPPGHKRAHRGEDRAAASPRPESLAVRSVTPRLDPRLRQVPARDRPRG